MMGDIIEFYCGDRMVAIVSSSMVPPVESLISIRAKTYTVLSVTYALDHADKGSERRMRANIDLEAR